MLEGVSVHRLVPAWWCVRHRVPLTRTDDELACAAGHSFAVIRGIPRFVVGHTYADAFGAQWNRYRRTQLDSYTGLPLTRTRLQRCLGPLWERLGTCTVLEAGCGAGRFTELLLARGAHVVSIDLSDAVDANAENCPLGPRHAVAQADMTELPFAPAQFDIVLALGVVQHTPRPERTIEKLAEHVRPGGHLVLDHYPRRLAWYTRIAVLFRQYFRRVPPAEGLRQSERLVRLLLPVHRAARRSHVLSALLFRVSPIMSYYYAIPELNDQLQREWALLDTHDSLTDRYQHRRTVSEIRRLLATLGFVDIHCAPGGNGVEARARRPA